MPLPQPNNVRDYNLQNLTALPAAGATANSASIDLGSPNPGPLGELGLELEVNIPATPALADTKTLTVTVQDSADNTNFSAVPLLGVQTLTGASGAGAGAANYRFPLPKTIRRFVRASFTIAAAGGNSTGVSARTALITPLNV